MITYRGRQYVELREAGWWGEGPLDGDASLDLLSKLAAQDPPTAARTVARKLRGGLGTDTYAAIGAWDYIVTTGPKAWQRAFRALSSSIPAAAKRATKQFIEEDGSDVYSHFGLPYLAKYSVGASGLARLDHDFMPLGGWYIQDVDIGYFNEDELHFDIIVSNGGETDTREDSINMPADAVSVEDVQFTNYGGAGASQQSVVFSITYTDEYGETMEVDEQVDLDSATGELKY